jgi:RNA polymerase sigma-70 factor, ECF subfamily
MVTVEETRSSLLVRIRDPLDHVSWKSFVDIYVPLIYHYLRQRGLQDADASDVTQEVLTDVARSIRSFDYQPEKGKFRNWLGMLTRRRCYKFWEKNRPTNPASEELVAAELETDRVWCDTFQSHLLQLAMAACKPRFEERTWHIFERTWLQSQTASQVSDELQIPLEIIYNARSRVLKQLEAEIVLMAEDCAWVQGTTRS